MQWIILDFGNNNFIKPIHLKLIGSLSVTLTELLDKAFKLVIYSLEISFRVLSFASIVKVVVTGVEIVSVVAIMT